MKKSFYLAALAMIAMSSCSSEDVADVQAEASQPEELERVVLGVGNAVLGVTTRGTGTVGSDDEATNRWHHEHLRVLMTVAGTDGSAVELQAIPGLLTEAGYKGQFDNSFYCIPDEKDGTTKKGQGVSLIAKPADGKDRFYPMSGYSNFFAYYVDDAAADHSASHSPATVDGDIVPELKNNEDGSKYVDFTIDGSQDIMAGMAPKPAGKAGFSAQTSRAGTIPSIALNHMLTRLSFTYTAGAATAAGVVIKKVEVESPTEGKLVVAYNASTPKLPSELITFTNPTTKTYLSLKDRKDTWYSEPATGDGSKENLVAFSAKTIAAADDDKQMGDALFVQPEQEQYNAKVTLLYPIKDNPAAYDPTPNAANADYNEVIQYITIKKPANATNLKFAQGTSYKVKLTIYGYQEIAVNVDLTPWTDGGAITPEVDWDVDE